MSPRLKGNLAAFVAMLFWATGFPAASLILETWDPLLLAPFRLALGAGVLIVVMLASGGARDLRATDWWPIVWIGGGILSASTLLLLYGQSLAHPVTVAVIISAMPLISAAIGMMGGTERLTWALACGIVLSVAGGIVVASGNATGAVLASSGLADGDIANGAIAPIAASSNDPMIGALLTFAAVTLFVAYSRACDARLPALSGSAKAGLTMFASFMVVGTMASAALQWNIVPYRVDYAPGTLALIGWLGAAAIAVSMALWFTSVRLLGVTVTAMHHNLVPFYVIVLSLAGGGAIAMQHWIGAALVIAGALIAQYAPAHAMVPATGPTDPSLAQSTAVPLHAAPVPPKAPTSRRRNVESGMLIMGCAMLYLPLIDTFAKLVSGEIAAGQIAWSRFFFQTVFLAPFALMRYRSWQPGNLPIHIARGALICTATVLFFAAVKVLPLADAISIFFIEPLILTVLSALILGEKIGWRRSLAVVVGFVGAMIVIRPSYAVFGAQALLPIGTALAFAFYLLLTRSVAQREDPITIQFMAGVAGLVIMTGVLTLGVQLEIPVITPVWPDTRSWLLLLGVGVVATTGHLMVVHAFKRAEAGILAPFQYLEIIPSVILGLLIFGDFPDALTWLGITVIIASGFYVFHRERMVERALERAEDNASAAAQAAPPGANSPRPAE